MASTPASPAPAAGAPHTDPIDSSAAPRSAEDLFGRLEGLGPFRIIHQAGPSTFEAIAPIVPSSVVGPFLNLISDAYHWHLQLSGVGHAQTFDQTHARSGRRVLFVALADRAPEDGGQVFTRLYVHRAKGAEFEPHVLDGFLRLHRALAGGRALASSPSPSRTET